MILGLLGLVGNKGLDLMAVPKIWGHPPKFYYPPYGDPEKGTPKPPKCVEGLGAEGERERE